MEKWEINLKRWSDKENLDETLAAELTALTENFDENKDELEERFYKELEFGTAGLRGVLGAGLNRMNVYTVRKTTQGLADYINEAFADAKEKSVAIGYDSRINSRLFAEATASVLAANGIKSYMYDELSTVPMLSFAVRKYKCTMGVMITASHNPAQYNGYKVYNGCGYQVTDDEAAAILERINSVDIFDGVKTLDFAEVSESNLYEGLGRNTVNLFLDCVMAEALMWTDNFVEISNALNDLKVVYTPLNGAGNKPVKFALGRLGIMNLDIVPEQEFPDGNFPTCPYPNPEKEEALVLGLELLKKKKADILVATDPDCDRVGVAIKRKDGTYRRFTGNEVGLMLFEYIINCRKSADMQAQANGEPKPPKGMPENPAVVRTIVTTSLIDEIAKANGVDVKVTLTGFKYIGEFITEKEAAGCVDDYIFGFEESYGYLSGSHVRDKDGVNAATLICLMAAKAKTEGKTLEDVLFDIYEKYGYCENYLMDFQFPGISGMAEMEAIMDSFRNEKQESFGGKQVTGFLDYKEGVPGFPKSNVVEYKLEGGSGFAVRPSGTEPKLKIYVFAKGKTSGEATSLMHALAEELSACAAK